MPSSFGLVGASQDSTRPEMRDQFSTICVITGSAASPPGGLLRRSLLRRSPLPRDGRTGARHLRRRLDVGADALDAGQRHTGIGGAVGLGARARRLVERVIGRPARVGIAIVAAIRSVVKMVLIRSFHKPDLGMILVRVL